MPGYFFATVTQATVIWDEEPLIEKMTPSDGLEPSPWASSLVMTGVGGPSPFTWCDCEQVLGGVRNVGKL